MREREAYSHTAYNRVIFSFKEREEEDRTVSPTLTRRFFNVSLCWILYRPCLVTLVISRTSENCGPQEQNKTGATSRASSDSQSEMI